MTYTRINVHAMFTDACPSGQPGIGACINGLCGVGFTCDSSTNLCCPVATGLTGNVGQCSSGVVSLISSYERIICVVCCRQPLARVWQDKVVAPAFHVTRPRICAVHKLDSVLACRRRRPLLRYAVMDSDRQARASAVSTRAWHSHARAHRHNMWHWIRMRTGA
jgi:hypothetical protein